MVDAIGVKGRAAYSALLPTPPVPTPSAVMLAAAPQFAETAYSKEFVVPNNKDLRDLLMKRAIERELQSGTTVLSESKRKAFTSSRVSSHAAWLAALATAEERYRLMMLAIDEQNVAHKRLMLSSAQSELRQIKRVIKLARILKTPVHPALLHRAKTLEAAIHKLKGEIVEPLASEKTAAHAVAPAGSGFGATTEVSSSSGESESTSEIGSETSGGGLEGAAIGASIGGATSGGGGNVGASTASASSGGESALSA